MRYGDSAYALAQEYLPADAPEKDVVALATAIQHAVEDWLAYEYREAK